MHGISINRPKPPLALTHDPNWAPFLGATSSPGWLPDCNLNSTTYNNLARFDLIHSGGPSGSTEKSNWQTIITNVNAVRAGQVKPPAIVSAYVNCMEHYLWRIRRIENNGDGTAHVYMDTMNGTTGDPFGNSPPVRIFGCEEDGDYNYPVSGAFAVIAGQHGYIADQPAWDAATTLPNKPPAPFAWVKVTLAGAAITASSVSNTRAIMARQNADSLQFEVTQKVAEAGWLVPDWSDTQLAGDWGVWGLQYRTLDLNLTCWTQPDAQGKRWPQWYAEKWAADRGYSALYASGTLTSLFSDNTWMGPYSFFGQNNGWGDWKLVGTNQNSQAATLEGRQVRMEVRWGHRTFNERLRDFLPVGWYSNSHASDGGETFPGTTDSGYRGRVNIMLKEHCVQDMLGSATEFNTTRNEVLNAKAGLAARRKAVVIGCSTNAGVIVLDEIYYGLAFYGMTFDDDFDAPIFAIQAGSGQAENLFANNSPALPAVMFLPWGQPVEARPTAPGGGGNGTNNNGSAIWHREFTNVIVACNPGTATQSFYPPLGPGNTPIWKDHRTDTPVGLSGISLAQFKGCVLVRI